MFGAQVENLLIGQNKMTSQNKETDLTDVATAEGEPVLNQFLGYNLKRTFNAIHANLVLTLKAFDLRMVTYSALIVILENRGLRQAELAKALRIDRGNAVAIVDELEKRKLITRDRHPDDRRSYALHITESGRELCESAIKADRECEARILSGLDASRLNQLFDTLSDIETAAYQELDRRIDAQDT